MEKTNEDVIDKSNKDIESETIEKFKNIIFNNWDTIKETIQSIKKNETKEINLYENGKIEFSFYFYYIKITHFFNKTISTYNIEKNSRKINFKKKEQDIQKIIFQSDEIIKYCKDLQFVHAVYDEDEKSNISVTSSNCVSIFFNEKIIEIYDDEFKMNINEDNFNDIHKEKKKVSELYYNIPNMQISSQINSDYYCNSDERDMLYNNIQYYIKKNYFIFLTGPQKIGKTITILSYFRNFSMLYLDFNLLFNEGKTKNNIKKIIYYETMNLFKPSQWEEYRIFINDFFNIQGYDEDIWNLLNKFCETIVKYKMNYSYKPIIIIDNYDDLFMKKNRKMDLNILFNLSSKFGKEITFLISGNGKYINQLIYYYFFPEQKQITPLEYKLYYIKDFHLKHDEDNKIIYLYKEYENEIENYFKKLYENKEEIIKNIIISHQLIKFQKNFNMDFLFLNIPLQFFIIEEEKKDDKKIITVHYQNEKYQKNFNKIILPYIIEKSIKTLNCNNHSLKGILFEGLITGLFECNKLIEGLEFKENNIIEVYEIYNITEKNENNINYGGSPILIKQKFSQGRDYDLCMIIEYNKIIHGLYIQIGLNKQKSQICKIYNNSFNRYIELKNSLQQLTGKEINYLDIIFIFDKNQQENYYKIYNEYENSQNYENDSKNKLNQIKNKNYIGSYVCEEINIPYLEFSIEDYSLYKNNIKINNIDDFFKYIFPVFKEDWVKIKNNLFKENKEEYDINDLFNELELNVLKENNKFLGFEQFKILGKLNYSSELINILPPMLMIMIHSSKLKILIFQKKYFSLENNKIQEINDLNIINEIEYNIYLIEIIFNSMESIDKWGRLLKLKRKIIKETKKKKKKK